MTAVQSTASCNIDLPPSCVEVSPSHPDYFLIGTYHLLKNPPAESKSEVQTEETSKVSKIRDAGDQDPSTQERRGSIMLCRTNGIKINREIIHTHPTDFAILDLHYSPHSPDIFCTANSTNSISFYNLQVEVTNRSSFPIRHLCTIETFLENSLVLSLQWHPIHTNQLGVSLSTGEVILCQLDTDLLNLNPKTKILQECVLRHEIEAWILGFTPSGTGMFSGGDDGVLQFAELRTANLKSEEQTVVDSSHALWTNRKLHGAGVTAILPLSESICITGSYDDHIRILSTPRTGRKTVLAELDLGGGVWRLVLIETWDPSWDSGADLEFHILASCMHAGARILRISRSAGAFKIEILGRFQEHESMNYGSSFQPVVRGKELVIISTSFYDKLVCLWKFRLD